MKVENLRSLIRESINEYISKINEAGDIAACNAKIAETEKAIAERQRIMAKDGLDETYHNFLDENKMKELKNDIKALEKNLTKLQKQLDKLNSKSKPKTEVVADAMTEEAPIDETDVMAGMDIAEESTEETTEEALNESFLKMQKLAGLIK
jgi:peptidoglycan hydrolase CwlO-like protein